MAQYLGSELTEDYVIHMQQHSQFVSGTVEQCLVYLATYPHTLSFIRTKKQKKLKNEILLFKRGLILTMKEGFCRSNYI